MFSLSLSPSFTSVHSVSVLSAEVGLNHGIFWSRSGGLGSRSTVISVESMEFEDGFFFSLSSFQSRSRSLTGGFFLASVVYPSSSVAWSCWVSLPWFRGCVVACFWGLRPVVFGPLFLSVLASGSSVDLWRSCVECPAGGSSALLVGLSSGSARCGGLLR